MRGIISINKESDSLVSAWFNDGEVQWFLDSYKLFEMYSTVKEDEHFIGVGPVILTKW